MIAIVDYGVGNLFSLSSSVRSLGAEVRVTHEAADLGMPPAISCCPAWVPSATPWPSWRLPAWCPY